MHLIPRGSIKQFCIKKESERAGCQGAASRVLLLEGNSALDAARHIDRKGECGQGASKNLLDQLWCCLASFRLQNLQDLFEDQASTEQMNTRGFWRFLNFCIRTQNWMLYLGQVALATVDLKAVNSSGGLIHLAQLSKATLVWSYWSGKFIHDPRFVTCSLSLFFRPCERTGRVVSWDWKVLTQLCISFFRNIYIKLFKSQNVKKRIYIII